MFSNMATGFAGLNFCVFSLRQPEPDFQRSQEPFFSPLAVNEVIMQMLISYQNQALKRSVPQIPNK